MNRKPSRYIAGICFLLYPVLSYQFFINLVKNFTENSGEWLTNSSASFLILCLAALLTGIGVLINKPAVTAAGSILFFLGYYLPAVLNFVLYTRYWGLGDLLLSACNPCVLASLLLFILCIARPAAKVLGIISGLLMLAGNATTIIRALRASFSISIPPLYYIREILLLAAFFLVGFAIHRKSTRMRRVTSPSGGDRADSSAISDEAYCGLVKHTCLLVFTFGIWLLIWIYRTTVHLNQVEGEDHRNPTNKLLLCMFIPLYFVYWTYQSGQRIDKLAATRNIPSNLSTLCPILLVLASVVSPILMQDKINCIITTEPDCSTELPVPPAAPPAAPAEPPAPPAPPAEVSTPAIIRSPMLIEELKVYKTLLDLGVITQEEFYKKKMQLLEL